MYVCRSSALGGGGNSPSALFVATDGSSLRMYQAVIDARTLLLHDSTATTQVRLPLLGVFLRACLLVVAFGVGCRRIHVVLLYTDWVVTVRRCANKR